MSVKVDLRFSDVDPPALEPKRSIYTDLMNLPDPVLLGLTVRIFNYDNVGLYMQVDGYGTGWTFTTNNIGLLGSGADMYSNLDNFGSRAKPGSEVSEQITVRLRAYTDAGYLNLKWTFERIIDMIFIKSDDGSWTGDFYDNFDDGTVMGWAVANEQNNTAGYPQIQVRTDYVLSAPYSIRMVQRWNAAHTIYQQGLYLRKGSDLLIKIGKGSIETGGACSVFGQVDLIPVNKWIRAVMPLPRNTLVEVQIADELSSAYAGGCWTVRGRLYKSFTTPDRNRVYAIMDLRAGRSGSVGYCWMDDFKIISKD